MLQRSTGSEGVTEPEIRRQPLCSSSGLVVLLWLCVLCHVASWPVCACINQWRRSAVRTGWYPYDLLAARYRYRVPTM